MKTRIFITAVIVLGLSAPIFGQGVLYQHVGANNPTDEGFTLDTSGAGGTASAIPNDGGVTAWSTQVGAGGTLWYDGQLSSTALAQSDWILSVNMRVLQSGPSFENSFVQVRTSDYIYSLWFATQADGDPLVRAGAFASGPVFVLDGAGAGYHDFQLRYSHDAGNAELWVDGVMRLSGITSSGQSGISVLQWGDGQAGPSGAYWNSVSFQVVPEPSSLALLLLGLLLFWRKWPNTALEATPHSHCRFASKLFGCLACWVRGASAFVR
jgi:hypothetical protein